MGGRGRRGRKGEVEGGREEGRREENEDIQHTPNIPSIILGKNI